jgi:hypothetical protein
VKESIYTYLPNTKNLFFFFVLSFYLLDSYQGIGLNGILILRGTVLSRMALINYSASLIPITSYSDPTEQGWKYFGVRGVERQAFHVEGN